MRARSLAGATAAEVDRVVFAVHRSISDDARQRIRGALSDIGLGSPTYWVDVAEFMAAGLLDDDLVKTRFRYSPTAALASVDELRELGLVDDELRLSDALVGVVGVVNDARLTTAAKLWGDKAGLQLLASGAEAMLEGAIGPLVEPYRRLPEPTDIVALLWHRLIGLRYLRSDAHAAAWQAAGLDAVGIVALTKAWNEGQHLSNEDRVLREAIEAETNRRSELGYRQLETARWSEWIKAMASLPSEP